MTRRVRAGGVALALLLAFAGLASSAGAQEQPANERLVIRQVDTTGFPEVHIQALSVGRSPDLGDFVLRENNRVVPQFSLVPVNQTGLRMAIVLLVDISRSMAENDKMANARAAAAAFVNNKRPDDEISLVTFGDRPTTVVDFTRDAGALLPEIEELAPIGGTSLYDGVRQASSLFEQRPGVQANIVVLSDGNDTARRSTLEQAKASAFSARAAVFALGMRGPEFNEAPLRELADDTGGFYLSTDDPAAFDTLTTQVQETLQAQYEIRYTSSSTIETLDLLLSAGAAQARATTNVGTLTKGIATAPQVVESKSGPFTGDYGLWAGLGLAALAVAVAVYALVRLMFRERSTLSLAMDAYTEGAESESGQRGHTFADTPLLQRAVSMTEDFARARGFLPKVERMLEKADLPLRAAEAIFFYAAFTVVVALLTLLLAPNVAIGLLVVLVVALVPPATLAFLAGLRHRRFQTQLPDMLQLLAGSLRAGYSLMQGVDTVSQEVQDPMGKELRRVVAESRLGRPLEEALEDTAERMESDDFAWAVMAIRIQREVGGNLAELLMTVSDTMLARERLRREVRALTAEGRISAIVLGILPIGLGLVMYTLNPDYIETLFDRTIGQVMLIGAGIMALVGFYWMKKTIEIEI